MFLRQTQAEIRINNYSDPLIRICRTNMDIQYVLNAYACAKYISSYMTKGQRGMSKLLEAACQEARAGNLDIKKQVCHIGNSFLNATEISAQEVVYLALPMPLGRLS